MIFRETRLPGVFEINLEPSNDSRGFFARSWCQKEFEDQALDIRVAQCNISFNIRSGTLRGMHYQAAPKAEAKLVRCTSGSIYDVVIDLRPESPTFKNWIAAVLTPDAHNMMYVPGGCAHGFLTLADNSEVFYQMSEFYSPDAARGVRWDDPAFQIMWPSSVQVISERDRTYPDFEPVRCAY
ncbi:MAG TPA: dTDP-4-dehydrorhamnose 3,5-epimerase [Candidatus Sulfotelmatobacter sp.]|nr:dTDP-4-dehydrorhamnose 3,5-epimerase [Candidatus Sulfotelmatobacter sp.]